MQLRPVCSHQKLPECDHSSKHCSCAKTQRLFSVVAAWPFGLYSTVLHESNVPSFVHMLLAKAVSYKNEALGAMTCSLTVVCQRYCRPLTGSCIRNHMHKIAPAIPHAPSNSAVDLLVIVSQPA